VDRAVRLGDLVARFGGRLESSAGGENSSGDPAATRVTGFASLAEAGPGQMSFLANPRYRKDVPATRAEAVLIRQSDADALRAASPPPSAVLWLCDNPYATFARVAQALQDLVRVAPAPGLAPGAQVAPDAQLGADASIGPGAVIGAGCVIGARTQIGAGCVLGAGVHIGADSLLYPRVVVYDACVLGARAIVHAGAVIGADGFGFARDGAAWVKIPQTGRVVIGDDVEIGANTTIDRGALADTVIGDGVKLDNQIQIGHNVRIGAHTAMAACVGIAGSATVGARCTVGGGAIILGHLKVADDVNISAASVVTHSLHQPGHYTGFYPIGDNAAWEKSAAVLKRLPELRTRLRRLEQGVAAAASSSAGPAAAPPPSDATTDKP